MPTYRLYFVYGLVFAFVVFNLLDLDGSNLFSLSRYAKRYILLGEPETEFRIKPVAELALAADPWHPYRAF